MREVRIEKITLNIGCGTTTPVDQARLILQKVTDNKIVITRTSRRTTFNVPKHKAIGCKVTIRNGTDEFLKRMLVAKENKLNSRNFDNTGNFAFGIKEYIDVPNVDYDPKLKIMGFDVCVTLERPGYRVKKKRLSSPIGKKHQITKDDAMNFVKEKFSARVE